MGITIYKATLLYPRRAWKQVEMEYAEKVSAGGIFLGTLEGYAHIENARRDEADGAVVIEPGYLTSELPDHVPHIERLRRYTGLSFGTIIGGEIQRQVQNANAFCMSNSRDSYDGYPEKPSVWFEVTDVVGLAEVLATKLIDRIVHLEVRPVSYERRRFSAQETYPQPDMFIKDESLSAEDEIRIGIICKPTVPHEPIDFKEDPDIAQFLRAS